MMIVSEGDTYGGAYDIQKKLSEAGNPFDSRVVVLGHILRGGSPCPEDRILAAELGAFAVESLHNGATSVMAGKIGGELSLTPLQDCITDHRKVSESMKELLKVLAS
jgi:6-phosphofructokinase 1